MSGTLSSQDQTFITTTSQDNISEITDGRLAEQQSSNLATAIYGRQLVADHSFVSQQTLLAAQLTGANVAVAADTTQQGQTSQLQGLTGAAFDQQYLSNEVQSNTQSITDGQTEGTSGQNPVIEQLNALLVPFQSQHLLQAQILQAAQTGAAAPAATQPTGSPALGLAPNGALNAQDQAFIQQAAAGSVDEIQAGQLAEQQSSDQAVDVFARWMVLDHTVLNAGLAPLAQAGGVTPSTAPDAQGTATLTALQGLTGSAFSQRYIASEVQSHVQTIEAFAKEAASGSDPALVALARSSLPLLEQHLAGAAQINTALGLGATDQSAAPSTALGQTAAGVGNATAAGVAAYAQALASPGNSSFLTTFLSSASDLFPATSTTSGSGTPSGAASTALALGNTLASSFLPTLTNQQTG